MSKKSWTVIWKTKPPTESRRFMSVTAINKDDAKEKVCGVLEEMGMGHELPSNKSGMTVTEGMDSFLKDIGI